MTDGSWLFVVICVVLIAAMFWVAAHTPRNVHPVEIDSTWQSIKAFYRDRPDRSSEVDLGNQWVSVYDPGAMFELSWIKATRELVALRHQAHPDLRMGGGVFSAIPKRMDERATGMKVLAVVDLRELHQQHPHRLERLADGLDQLTAGLGAPYDPPHPEDAHWLDDAPP